MNETDTSCREITFVKRDPTIPWTSVDLSDVAANLLVHTSIAQNWAMTACGTNALVMERERAGKQWKFVRMYEDGSGYDIFPSCATCGSRPEKSGPAHRNFLIRPT